MRPRRSTPYEIEGNPPGLPYIVLNEVAERFSFAGMSTILVVFMTTYMVDATGARATIPEPQAKAWFHAFAAAVYFFPLLGSVLADAFLGKYRTIYWLSIVYCLGHLALALGGTRLGLLLGLGLIAVGSGGIKPCVAAHLGDQFGEANAHRVERTFTWFYFAINIGSVLAIVSTPWLLDSYGPHVAFGVPGLLMLVATSVFRGGRDVYVHAPPAGIRFVRKLFSRDGLGSMGRLIALYAFVSVFWSLFSQTGSAWVLQAQRMDRFVFGFELLPAQIQAVQPILALIMIPASTYLLYPALRRIVEPTPVRRIGLGMALIAVVFALIAGVEAMIVAGAAPSIAWHLVAYVLLTMAEVLVAVTCIELSYVSAPESMKSFVMALFALSVALGNVFTSVINFVIAGEDGGHLLEGAAYYLFFAGMMAATLLLYVPFARWFQARPAPVAS